MNHVQIIHDLIPAILEKKLIDAVNENNLADVKILLKGEGDALGPALLMATSAGYNEIVEELIWRKDNRGHLCDLREGINISDILSALNNAKINKENASQDNKKVWINIVHNLSWGLVQILEDRKM